MEYYSIHAPTPFWATYLVSAAMEYQCAKLARVRGSCLCTSDHLSPCVLKILVQRARSDASPKALFRSAFLTNPRHFEENFLSSVLSKESEHVFVFYNIVSINYNYSSAQGLLRRRSEDEADSSFSHHTNSFSNAIINDTHDSRNPYSND